MLSKEDYYVLPNGLMVFTEQYHLKRGYCCGSKCKHCPYHHERVPNRSKEQCPTPTPANNEKE